MLSSAIKSVLYLSKLFKSLLLNLTNSSSTLDELKSESLTSSLKTKLLESLHSSALTFTFLMHTGCNFSSNSESNLSSSPIKIPFLISFNSFSENNLFSNSTFLAVSKFPRVLFSSSTCSSLYKTSSDHLTFLLTFSSKTSSILSFKTSHSGKLLINFISSLSCSTSFSLTLFLTLSLFTSLFFKRSSFDFLFFFFFSFKLLHISSFITKHLFTISFTSLFLLIFFFFFLYNSDFFFRSEFLSADVIKTCSPDRIICLKLLGRCYH